MEHARGLSERKGATVSGIMKRVTDDEPELLPDLTYDVCVLTGDYRGATFGPFDAALDVRRTTASTS
jgi:hypothetical protein